MLSQERGLAILQALADPHRLQLYEILLKGDRNNTELFDKTGLRHNLLSHHLTVMADCGLVRAQQSMGDARRYYYSADLATAHHVGEWWTLHTPVTDRALPALKRPRRVLFMCLHNTTRSVMAECLARHLAPDALVAFSAGLRAAAGAPLLPAGRRVLDAHGVAVNDAQAKTYHDIVEQATLDYVIAVCDIVHEAMLPAALADATYLHWSLRDPEEGMTEDERLALAHRLYDELMLRITFLVQRLAHEEMQAETAGAVLHPAHQ